jgi:hypothetical protein
MLTANLLLSSLLLASPTPGGFYDISEHYRYLVQVSVATRHFSPRPEHHNTQQFKGFERFGDNYFSAQLERRFPTLAQATPLIGAAYFRNSYDQPTVYAYTGYRKPVLYNQQTQIYAKVTMGVIHGYRGRYQGRIPFNQLGTAPAVIPSVGLQHQQVNAEMIFFGLSGVMLNIGYSF